MSDSTTYRNVIYRLLPGDAATANQLLGIWDACRFTWNEIKEAREIQYAHACGRRIESPTFFTLGTAFKTLWDQTDWLRKHSYSILRYTLRYQADAWKAFFEGRAGYPKWKHPNTATAIRRSPSRKSSASATESLRSRRSAGCRSAAAAAIRIRPAGRPVKAVIRRIGRRWEAVVCYEVPAPQPNDNGRIIGVDRNAGQVADSDGEIHRMPDLALLETKLKRHQRGLAKKRKGSRRRARQRMRVQRAHRRLANARKN